MFFSIANHFRLKSEFFEATPRGFPAAKRHFPDEFLFRRKSALWPQYSNEANSAIGARGSIHGRFIWLRIFLFSQGFRVSIIDADREALEPEMLELFVHFQAKSVFRNEEKLQKWWEKTIYVAIKVATLSLSLSKFCNKLTLYIKLKFNSATISRATRLLDILLKDHSSFTIECSVVKAPGTFPMRGSLLCFMRSLGQIHLAVFAESLRRKRRRFDKWLRAVRFPPTSRATSLERPTIVGAYVILSTRMMHALVESSTKSN